jgi:predicted ATPase
MGSRSPIFIELIGTPAAGKTTLAARLNHYFNSNGVTCTVAAEPNLDYPGDPADKLKPVFNQWTLQESARLMDSYRAARDFEIVIFDRGLVDSLYWLSWFRSSRGFSEEEYIRKVAASGFYLKLMSQVFILTCSYEVAVDRRSGGGRIMNPGIYPQLLANYNKASVSDEIGLNNMSHMRIDTSEIQVDTVEGRARSFLAIPRHGERDDILSALVRINKA